MAEEPRNQWEHYPRGPRPDHPPPHPKGDRPLFGKHHDGRPPQGKDGHPRRRRHHRLIAGIIALLTIVGIIGCCIHKKRKQRRARRSQESRVNDQPGPIYVNT